MSLEVLRIWLLIHKGTIDEAVPFRQTVGRDNVMIKVPEPQGYPPLRELLSQGININVTLLFSVVVYEQVAWSYIRGLNGWRRIEGICIVLPRWPVFSSVELIR